MFSGTDVFYGYGVSSPAGYAFADDFTPKDFGPTACPPERYTTMRRPWDDGDSYPLRTCERAKQWEEAHKAAGIVLQNRGYKGNRHSCSCNVAECTHDYECLMAKLGGKPPPAGCA